MKVKRQDKLVLLATFLFGIIAGSYLFIVGFAPTFEDTAELPKNIDADTSALVIEGEQYGGMRIAGTVPSFRLEADGSYRYLPFTEQGSEPVIAEGTIKASVMDELSAVLTPAVLGVASEPFTPDMCAMMVDGNEYTYTITKAGVTYELDTCGTRFSNDSEIGQLLWSLWQAMDTSVLPVQ